MMYADGVTKYLMMVRPAEDVRMQDIVAYVEPAPKDQKTRHRVRMQVLRVLAHLKDAGLVVERPSSHARGGYYTYRWVAN